MSEFVDVSDTFSIERYDYSKENLESELIFRIDYDGGYGYGILQAVTYVPISKLISGLQELGYNVVYTPSEPEN